MVPRNSDVLMILSTMYGNIIPVWPLMSVSNDDNIYGCNVIFFLGSFV